ncbi:unnamed protein product, partial [Closterium sp. NIES-64]
MPLCPITGEYHSSSDLHPVYDPCPFTPPTDVRPSNAPSGSGGSGGNAGDGGSGLYIVRLRSAPPLAAYRGAVARFPGGWADDNDDDENNDSAARPAGLMATAKAVAAAVKATAGRIPRRARLSLKNPQIKAYAQMLESQQTRIASEVGVAWNKMVHRCDSLCLSATSEYHNRATEHPSLPFPPPPTPRSYKRISQQGDRTPFPSLPSSPHPPQLQANLTTGRQNTLPFPSLLPPPPAATSESHNRVTEHPSLPFPPPPTPRSYKRISQQGDRTPFPSLPSSPHPPQLQANLTTGATEHPSLPFPPPPTPRSYKRISQQGDRAPFPSLPSSPHPPAATSESHNRATEHPSLPFPPPPTPRSYKRISQQGDRTPFPSLPSSPHPPQLQANLTTGRQNTLPFPSLLPPPPAATSESHNRVTEHPSLPFPPPPTPRSYKRISQQGDRTPFPSLPSSPHPPQLQANLTTGVTEHPSLPFPPPPTPRSYKRISQQGNRTPFPSLPSSPHPPQLQANLTTGRQSTLPFPSLLPPPPAATSESHNRATEHPSLPFPPPPTPRSYKRISQQGDRAPFPSLPSSPHPPQLQANLTTGRQSTLPFPSLLPPPPAATSTRPTAFAMLTPAGQLIYKHTSNGFSAMFTPGKLWRLKRHPAVASVRRSTLKRLLTTDSPTFLVMNTASSGTTRSLWPANGGQAKAGDGMVIAIADSGIWPEHPSFSDKGFSSSGKCDATGEFKCNNKVIGARAFYQGAAAGNSGVPMAGGTASGMAPAARLVAYKVLWSSSRGGDSRAEEAGIIAAVNQGVADGVDVISLSLGVVNPTDTYFDNIAFLNANLVSPSPLPDPLFSLLGSPDLFSHPTYFDDIAFLNANLAGVVVTFAGGNSGSPGFATRTIDNYAPFYLTVGA